MAETKEALGFGWIKPDGTWVECEYAAHGAAVMDFWPDSSDPELDASAAGWVRVSTVLNPGYKRKKDGGTDFIRPTKLQMRALERWAQNCRYDNIRKERWKRVNDFELLYL